jgi:amino acid permease
VVILLLAFFITYFTLKHLIRLHENGRIRYETYYKLGQRAFGDRAGLWIILPLQLFVEVSLDILHMERL